MRLVGISIDEREMPREGDRPNREMDVARVGDKALRKRQASWKQPLFPSIGGEEKALWLTTNEGPECVRWMTWSFASMRERAWSRSQVSGPTR